MAAKSTLKLLGMMLLLISIYARHQQGGNCANRGNCFENSECINNRCECLPGYGRNGMGQGGPCFDIDECTDGTDNCDDVLATCTNTGGSFTCTCDDGYTGDGVTCTPVMCEDPPAGCNTEAVPPGINESPGATFSYVCLPSFVPYYEDVNDGNFEITCMSNGDWSGGVTGPSCTRECEEVPSLPDSVTLGIVPKTGCTEFYERDSETSISCPAGQFFDLLDCECVPGGAACFVP